MGKQARLKAGRRVARPVEEKVLQHVTGSDEFGVYEEQIDEASWMVCSSCSRVFLAGETRFSDGRWWCPLCGDDWVESWLSFRRGAEELLPLVPVRNEMYGKFGNIPNWSQGGS